MPLDFLFLYILIIHYLGDFALQTHNQAVNKSISNKFLTLHVIVYSLVWWVAMITVHQITQWGLIRCTTFAIITFIMHWITDYCTSRISKPFFAKGDYHNGFAMVGADQIFHYIQLYFTYKMLC